MIPHFTQIEGYLTSEIQRIRFPVQLAHGPTWAGEENGRPAWEVELWGITT